MFLGQNVIGYVQYFTHLPELVVGVHMFGSCLVWIAVLRVFLAQRERAELSDAPAPGDSSESTEGEPFEEAGEAARPAGAHAGR